MFDEDKCMNNSYLLLTGRKKLEDLLNIKIVYRGKEITVHGSPEDEEMAIQMIDSKSSMNVLLKHNMNYLYLKAKDMKT